jgi:hypothetical protein
MLTLALLCVIIILFPAKIYDLLKLVEFQTNIQKDEFIPILRFHSNGFLPVLQLMLRYIRYHPYCQNSLSYDFCKILLN